MKDVKILIILVMFFVLISSVSAYRIYNETIINDRRTADIDGIEILSDNNVFIAFDELTDDETNYQGVFKIVTKNGSTVIDKIIYNVESTGSVFAPSLDRLSNDNVPIVFSNNTNKTALFTIYNKSGNKLFSEKKFIDNTLSSCGSIDDIARSFTNILSDESIFIVFGDSSCNLNLSFKKYDSNGNTLINRTYLNGNIGTYSVSSSVFDNDNILIAFNDATVGYYETYGSFIIINSSGNFIKNKTKIYTNKTMYFATEKLSNNNVVVAYQDYVNKNGAFVIYNGSGDVVKNTTIFEVDWVYDIDIVSDDNNFYILYSNRNESFKGYFTAYDNDGNEIISSTEFTNLYFKYPKTEIISNNVSLVGYVGNERARILTIDFFAENNIPTAPTIISPTATTYNINNISLTITSSDADDDDLTFYHYIDNVLNHTSSTNSSVYLSEGSYIYTVSAYDGYGYSQNSSVSFNIVIPTITEKKLPLQNLIELIGIIALFFIIFSLIKKMGEEKK